MKTHPIHHLALATLLTPFLYLAGGLTAQVMAADSAKPLSRIVSTAPSLTGILLAMDAPVVASAATKPSRISDDKGFFSQWAKDADEREVQVLYRNLQFDIEAVIGADPDLLVVSATGADSIVPYMSELEAQGIDTVVIDYSNNSWQSITTELGQVTGLQAQAKAAIERFDAYVAEAASRIEVPQGKASIVAYNIGGSYSIASIDGPHARLLGDLGLQVVGLPQALKAQVTRTSDFEFISRENLSAAITGESVFLMGAGESDVQAFLADPLLANLPAVKSKQVYPLGLTSFRIDPYSGRQMVDIVAQKLR